MIKRALLVAAATTLFGAGSATLVRAGDAESAVKCGGVNSCKGTSSCKTSLNSCKGQNSCKGLGWREVTSESACVSLGGKVI
jgi:hypothetical protein